MLENLVFMELMYRYGNVSTVDVDGKEIDFMSYDQRGDPIYFQVSVSIADRGTREREQEPIRKVRDNYPKTIVTLERYPYDNIDGIRIVDAIRFLTEIQTFK